jgi:hypothetical protein
MPHRDSQRLWPWYFRGLPAVDGYRDIVTAISNKLPRKMRDSAARNLGEISHGQYR